jgi:hypothetical protein
MGQKPAFLKREAGFFYALTQQKNDQLLLNAKSQKYLTIFLRLLRFWRLYLTIPRRRKSLKMTILSLYSAKK